MHIRVHLHVTLTYLCTVRATSLFEDASQELVQLDMLGFAADSYCRECGCDSGNKQRCDGTRLPAMNIFGHDKVFASRMAGDVGGLCRLTQRRLFSEYLVCPHSAKACGACLFPS